MKLWICGQWVGESGDYFSWEFQGVFTTEELAITACRDANYFIAPIKANVSYQHEREELPNAYYPLAGVSNA